jgi:hypothetical protein
MRNLLRKPLTWMVLAECAVVAALVMLAWHLIATAPAMDSSGSPLVAPPVQAGGPARPVSPNLPARSPRPALLPGLNVGADFWRSRLAELNRGEAQFEMLEWKLVHAAMDSAHRYVESVVLPSIARVERLGR